MAINDTIKGLTKIYQSIDRGIPKTADSPDALVNHLNDLYSESGEDLSSRELFTYDDVGSPTITITLDIDVEFDPQSDTWQRLPDMPIGLLGMTVNIVDGNVYIIGGSATKYPHKPYLADVLVYSPDP